MRKVLLLFYLSCSWSMSFSQNTGASDRFIFLSEKYPESVISSGSKKGKNLALTFDDGPTEITAPILDILDKHNIKATFFWQGKYLSLYPEVVERAIESSHELGNHSWDHPNCLEMNAEDLLTQQLLPTEDLYDSLYGLKTYLYRPPYGAVSETQLDELEEKGYVTVLWSLSTLDWDVDSNSTEEMVARFEKGLHPGAIILMHDMDFNESAFEKLKALERIIKLARQKDYRFSTISEITETTR